jgi:hypothetical protein
MPSSSAKQHRFMAAVANNPKFAKRVGVPTSVGEDFMKADKGKKFREGGNVKMSKADLMKLGRQEMKEHKEELKEHAEEHKAMKKMGYAKGGGVESKGKTKGKMVRMAMGGAVRGSGCESKGKTRGKFV